MTWFRAADSRLHRNKSLDSSESTSHSPLSLALLSLTTCDTEETDTLVSDSSVETSSLLRPESDQFVLSTLQLPTPETDTPYFDDMAAPATLYNGELGTPQTLFFHHARALFENKCLDPQRMLRGYVEMDFCMKDLHHMLGQETNKVLLQFCIDRVHIPAIGHPTYLAQTTLRNNRQLWRAYGTAQQRYWTTGNGNEHVARVEPNLADLEAFFLEVRGRFRCNVS